MDNMKCLKNKKTGNVIRVTDVQAYQMAGSQWSYVPKSEWKLQEGKLPTKKEEQDVTKDKASA
jgi:hypothetical protein